MVFDIWNNEVIIRLFNAFLLLMEDFYFVCFGTKGAVCKIWQHLVAKMALVSSAPFLRVKENLWWLLGKESSIYLSVIVDSVKNTQICSCKS